MLLALARIACALPISVDIAQSASFQKQKLEPSNLSDRNVQPVPVQTCKTVTGSEAPQGARQQRRACGARLMRRTPRAVRGCPVTILFSELSQGRLAFITMF